MRKAQKGEAMDMQRARTRLDLLFMRADTEKAWLEDQWSRHLSDKLVLTPLKYQTYPVM